MQWYYSKNSTQLGPVPDADFRAKLASGEVGASEMVWREGMTDWVPVSTVPEFSALLQNRMSAVPSAGTPYAPPMVQGIPGGGMYATTPTSGLAIASLICGIMGLVTCLFVPGIPAVICGHLALKRIADTSSPVQGHGLAVAGLITGYISVLFIVGFVLLMVLGFASSMTL